MVAGGEAPGVECRAAVSSCTAGGAPSVGGGGGGWFWESGDGREMLSAMAGARGARGLRVPSGRSSIPCRLLLTRRWTVRPCQVGLPWPSAGRGGLGGSSGQATTRRRRRRPGVRWRCGSCALIRLAALPIDPVGDRALPAVGREVELGGDGAQLRRCEGEQLAAGRRVLGRHCATFGSSRS